MNSRLLLILLLLAPRALRALSIEPESARIKTAGAAHGGGWLLWSNGEFGDFVECAADGLYRLEVEAKGSPAADEWPIMRVMADGEPVGTAEVGSQEYATFEFRLPLAAGHRRITAMFVNDLLTDTEDRNLYVKRIKVTSASDVPDPVPGDPAKWREAWSKAQADSEEKALAEAEADIERFRKQDAVVELRDAAGAPLKGANVEVEQKTHEFLFGCNIYAFDRFASDKENEDYKRLFAGLFNYATVGFYWRWYEPQRGKPHYGYTDKVVAWCGERGIRMKGHPLLWDHEAGIPQWAGGAQPPADVRRRRVEEIIGRYAGKIEFWEVVNEPAHLPGLAVNEPYSWAREAAPDAHLIINDYHVLADGCPQFYALLEKAIADNVPFDGIGIQAHEPRTMRFPLMFVRKTLDRYASLGKKLHITEFTPVSAGAEITGSHITGPWTEEAQAEYAVKFYTVCFAHPAIVAITWWDLCDAHSWLPAGGLLRKDLSPKPAYSALKELIHSKWKTRAAGKTDDAGRFCFRGFKGAYSVRAEHAGKRVETDFVLTGAGPALCELKAE